MTEPAKLTTSTAALRDVFSSLNGVVERRNTIPILGAVHISKDVFTVTDLDFQVDVKGGVKQSTDTPFAIDYRSVRSLLPHIDSDDFSIEVSDGLASLEFNGSQYSAVSFDSGEFPFLNLGEAKKSNIGNAGIIEAIKAVRFAVSNEETRYYLNGISFSEDESGNPGIVATNGHLLAFKPITYMPDGAKGTIVPKKPLDYLISQSAKPDSCQFTELMCRFTYPGISVTAKLIDGTYPQWLRVTPSDATPHVTFDRKVFYAVCRRIAAYSIGKGEVCSVIQQQDTQIKLSGGILGEKFSELIDAEVHNCEFPKIGIKAKYLVQICEAFKDCEKITFAWEKGCTGSPVEVTGDTSDLRVIVMPMRI